MMKPHETQQGPLYGVMVTLTCLYAPYSWIVMIGGPWDSYRWHWFRLWPILPGLLVHAIPGVHQWPDPWSEFLMAGATGLIVALVVWLTSRNRKGAGVIWAIVALLSGANAWIAYQLYLA
ncbi:MAG TPA: hypothetical protein VFT74_18515 [Isosphaeraceae bacterium]|nr:hypothetical protein [Isosphaeraceae bacterium]